MKAAVARWGNSLALRLPRGLAEEVRLNEGAAVELTVRDGALVVTPRRRRYRLDDLLAEMPRRKRGSSGAKGKKSDEVDWGAPVGEEIW